MMMADSVPIMPADGFPPVLTGQLGAPADRAQALQIHTDLRNRINELSTLAECANFYDNDAYYKECLHLLRETQAPFVAAYRSNGNMNATQARMEWARLWALALKRNEAWAMALNECRKTALTLLYRVANLTPPPPPGAVAMHQETVLRDQILHEFQMRRLQPIWVLTLAMDRANCLYRMTDTLTGEDGLGWYTNGEEEMYQRLRNPPLPLNSSGNTINKRLNWMRSRFFPNDEFSATILLPAAPDRFF